MAKKEISINFPGRSEFISTINLRKNELSEIKNNLKSVWIFGAGNNGKLIAKELINNNIEVLGFIDDTPSKINTTINDIKVVSFTSFKDIYRSGNSIFISIFNPSTPFQKLISKFIDEGISSKAIYSFINFIQIFNHSYLFLGPVQKLTKHYESFKSSFDRLTDNESKRTFLNYINFQTGLSGETITSPFFKGFEKILKASSVDFIDIGAFDGDTIVKFEKEFGNKLKTVYAFEPDVLNYNKLLHLANKKKRLKIICFNMAVGYKSSVLTFNGEGNMGSMLSKKGKELVQCVAIDDLIKPNNKSKLVIKIDVEGFELSVLNGMKELIRKNAPALVVSAYHKTNDVFDIISFVTKQHKYKNINIKQHGADGADLSLYFY